MIERYAIKSINAIWSEQNKLDTWWEAEKSICAGWHAIGVINDTDWAKIDKAGLKIDIERMQQLEAITKHDVVAFTRMISEQLGDECRWIHLGVTSTDIVDTCQNFLIKQSNELLEKSLKQLINTLKTKAVQYRNVAIMGRTHGIYGEPTSLGLKFLLWYDEWQRQIQRLTMARTQIEVVKLSGSMGNFAHVEPEVERVVAERFELQIDPISTQVTQRDRHAFLLEVFANMASTLEKMATEIRLFQQSEIGEWMEGFNAGQKGSSSMPHKKNPISSENICGLSRLLQANVQVGLQNNVLWHERDISHSSNERIILPDSYHLLIYAVNRMVKVLDDLVINKQAIANHLKEARNVFYSQVILTEILKTKNISREEAYDFIQQATQNFFLTKTDFIEVLIQMNVEQYISKNRLVDLCKIDYFLRNVDVIFERVL